MKKLDIKKLERLRSNRGYSMEKVSYLLGYSGRTAYTLKVTGKRKFSIDDIANLSDLYGCTIDSLFTCQEKENRKVAAAIC